MITFPKENDPDRIETVTGDRPVSRRFRPGEDRGGDHSLHFPPDSHIEQVGETLGIVILLFPDSHYANDHLVLDDPERRPVFTNPDPVPWRIGRATPDFLPIPAVKRVRGVLLERDRNSDPCHLGQRGK
jgi:hypothetical protein